MSADTLQVAVAVIVNQCGEVLISLRPDHVHQGGLWEFPGGKLEAGESVQQALKRELGEELGIHVTHTRPLIRVPHDYPDRRVLLDVWWIDGFDGEVHGREGQAVAWVAVDALSGLQFPEANKPIVKALQLPQAYLITPDPGEDIQRFLQQLKNCLQHGIRLVQLRAPSLADNRYLSLAEEVIPLCHRYGARVVLNAEPDQVMHLGADGLHLNSQRLQHCSRRTLDDKLLVIASCHDPLQLEKACAIGADAAVLSPVKATASHPGARPLGWPRFAEWVERCAIPVYALGGMTPADIHTAQANGGQGVAAIRALWNDA